MCKSRLVSEVTKGEGHVQYYLGSVNSTHQDDDDWTVTLNIGNTPIDFKIDTEADCTVISESVFKTQAQERPTESKETTEWSKGWFELFRAVYNTNLLHGQNIHFQGPCH